jgi:hypothetical protein
MLCMRLVSMLRVSMPYALRATSIHATSAYALYMPYICSSACSMSALHALCLLLQSAQRQQTPNTVATTFFTSAPKGVILYEPFGGLCAGLETVLRSGIPVAHYDTMFHHSYFNLLHPPIRQLVLFHLRQDFFSLSTPSVPSDMTSSSHP